MVFDQRSHHWGASRPPRYTARKDDPQVVLQNPPKGKGFTKWFPTNFEFWKVRLVQPYSCRIFWHPKLEMKSTSIIRNANCRVKSPRPPNFWAGFDQNNFLKGGLHFVIINDFISLRTWGKETDILLLKFFGGVYNKVQYTKKSSNLKWSLVTKMLVENRLVPWFGQSLSYLPI